MTDVDVAVGETITFRITNTAGYPRDFWIGPADALMNGETTGLIGTPEYPSGTREFARTVPADAGDLVFGRSIPGHYAPEHGRFDVAGAPSEAPAGAKIKVKAISVAVGFAPRKLTVCRQTRR